MLYNSRLCLYTYKILRNIHCSQFILNEKLSDIFFYRNGNDTNTHNPTCKYVDKCLFFTSITTQVYNSKVINLIYTSYTQTKKKCNTLINNIVIFSKNRLCSNPQVLLLLRFYYIKGIILI